MVDMQLIYSEGVTNCKENSLCSATIITSMLLVKKYIVSIFLGPN